VNLQLRRQRNKLKVKKIDDIERDKRNDEARKRAVDITQTMAQVINDAIEEHSNKARIKRKVIKKKSWSSKLGKIIGLIYLIFWIIIVTLFPIWLIKLLIGGIL